MAKLDLTIEFVPPFWWKIAIWIMSRMVKLGIPLDPDACARFLVRWTRVQIGSKKYWLR